MTDQALPQAATPESALATAPATASRARRLVAWVWDKLVWIVLALLLIAAAGVLSLRYWVLPNVERYREPIAQSVSKAIGQRVTIGGIQARWDGLRPQLRLDDVVLHDRAGREALKLQRVDSTLSWLSVPTWSARFHALDFYDPVLDIRRNSKGVFSIAGIEMSGDSKEGGFSKWLLAQRDIEIHNAAIDWTDELRGTPLLTLRDVTLHLVNRGGRHRFGLKAVPPRHLAGPIDLRGDVEGKSFSDLAGWSGHLFVQVDYADIAAWRTWIPYGFSFPRGAGAVRAWAGFKGQTLTDLTADVRLSDVRTRLAKHLPELDLVSLAGRVGWKKTPNAVEFFTRQLALTTSGDLALPPMDFVLKATVDAGGRPTAGEISANAIDLAPLISLADHLPFDDVTRKRIADVAPQGRLFDVHARWEGMLPEPAKYNARARFEDLAINGFGVIPGLRGISGNIDATEKSGHSQLTARDMKLDMPEVFKEALRFDTLTAHAAWTRDLKTKGFEIKLSNVSYHNADLSGSLTGSYRATPDEAGLIDVTGNLNRADARAVMRYLPLTVAKSARPWMESAFLAGTSGDVNFRVKGDLKDFPFPDNKGGTFFVTAKVSGGTLHYGDGWPNIENIDGDLAFRGKRMDIVAQRATIYGVRLSKLHAELPDLSRAETRILAVTGEAEGQTQDFLKFIATSPVTGYIDRFTEGMQGEGAGRLELKLALPLADMDKSRIAGTYHMTNNRLVIEPSTPPLEQVSGRLEFTEAGVNVPNASATFFGGPLTISGSTQRDGTIRMALQGRVAPDTVRRAGGPVWLTHVRGATDWRGTVSVRNKTVDMVLESNLQGMASALPAPFVKTAAESVALRVERRFVSSGRDVVSLTYGDVISARLHRHADGKRTVIDRGVVRLGGGAAGEPERDGVWVSGALKSANLDGWLKLAGGVGSAGSPGGGSATVFTLAGLDVKFGELEVYDRRFGDIAIASTKSDAVTTRYILSGKEFEGTAEWQSKGAGRLTANMKRLILPAATPSAAAAAPVEKPVATETPQLPALDIIAENFQIGARPLGRLELKATPKDRDWAIDQLVVSNPDGELTVRGAWQSWLADPRTNVTVNWTINDAGKMLTRLGYPEGMRRGKATLSGALSWSGGPHQLDFPTLSGNFTLQAQNGQFVKMEPGLAKLLGVLSLQSLPRRLSLDFRDVFGDGFAFDEMLGAMTLNRGVVLTDNFRINGPSAKVVMSGQVDINRETQNLHVKVNPHVSNVVSIVGAIAGGPVAGLAALALQQIAKDPLTEMVAFNYSVTGSWADPVVARTSGATRAEAPNPDSARNPGPPKPQPQPSLQSSPQP